jgi:hypothetical protein
LAGSFCSCGQSSFEESAHLLHIFDLSFSIIKQDNAPDKIY